MTLRGSDESRAGEKSEGRSGCRARLSRWSAWADRPEAAALVRTSQSTIADWPCKSVLRRNDHLVTTTLEVLAEENLRFACAIGSGSIEMHNTELRGLSQ